MSCHSVAVVLTLVQTKQIRIYINETIKQTQYRQYKTQYIQVNILQKRPLTYLLHGAESFLRS